MHIPTANILNMGKGKEQNYYGISTWAVVTVSVEALVFIGRSCSEGCGSTPTADRAVF